MGMRSEMEVCLERLEELSSRLDDLMTLVGRTDVRRSPLKDVARTKMRELKEHLESERRRMSTASGRRALNEVDDSYYAPTVLEAAAEITVRWNSVPNEEWMSQLMGAQVDVDHIAQQLRDQLA